MIPRKNYAISMLWKGEVKIKNSFTNLVAIVCNRLLRKNLKWSQDEAQINAYNDEIKWTKLSNIWKWIFVTLMPRETKFLKYFINLHIMYLEEFVIAKTNVMRALNSSWFDSSCRYAKNKYIVTLRRHEKANTENSRNRLIAGCWMYNRCISRAKEHTNSKQKT